MFRTVLSLVLMLTQGGLAPLYVCTSPQGRVRLDLGPVSCTSCQPEHACGHEHHEGCHDDDAGLVETVAGHLPCDCRHESIGQEGQRLAAGEFAPAGDLLMLPLATVFAAERSIGGRRTFSLQFAHSHGPLAERATVCLRC